jgi:hypothetical protein|tara:strand:- start:42 stop:503 length:462 start_codon:yes stop_codon:yes gene_type:complete
MFGLFESKKSKWKKRLIKGFDVFNPGIEGLDPEEIGMMLDKAQFIKESSLILLDKDDPGKAYWEDPLMIEEGKALDRLDFWHNWMLGWSAEGVMGNAKVAAFNIYFYSLGAGIYPDLRIRGKKMWKALSRGFKHCGSFDPKKDIPIGFEKFNK